MQNDIVTEKLTAAETEVAKLVAKGYSNQQIANERGSTEKTVRCQVSNILAKLCLFNRNEIAAQFSTEAAPIAVKTVELTNREQEILPLVAEGKTNQEIADIFITSERTVRTQVSNLIKKLGVQSRLQLGVYYRETQAA